MHRKCGLGLSLVLFKMACPHDLHTRTHREAPFVKHMPWLPQRQKLVVWYRHRAAAEGMGKMKKNNQKRNIASVLAAVVLVPIVVGSYNNTHARTRTLTRGSTVSGCHKGESLKRGCCTAAA